VTTNISLDTRQWSRLRDAFGAAVTGGDEQQRASLDELGAENPELARMLAELLAAHRHASGRTGEIRGELLDAAADAFDGLSAGERVGGFELRDVIGRGGMGVVYRAERVDGHVRQAVAIKLLQRHRLDADALRRFRLERDLVASLRHPNIANLLDAGETAAGVPYYVLELIDGSPLTTYCDQRGLGIRARLAVFLEVCAAVQHAHANLVLHRDIKPGNILVTGDGVPKLIDFGIAKRLPGAAPVDATQTQQQFLTPSNAAPEQLLGQRSTVACDVYQLGTVLYELLCGEPVFGRDALTPAALESAILSREPESMAARLRGADDARIRALGFQRREAAVRSLAGDLEHIVQKALRKRPDDRYASVDLLAQDVRAYLEARPVSARRGRFGYRARRFARRNAALLAFGLVLAGIGAAGAISTAHQARVALAQRDRADQTAQFLALAFKSVDPSETLRPELSISEVVANGIRRIDTMPAIDEALAAELRSLLGEVSVSTSQNDVAIRLLNQAQQAFDADPGEFAPDLVARNLLHLARAYAETGENQAAIDAARRGIALLRRDGGGGDLLVDLEIALTVSEFERVSRKDAIPHYRSVLERAKANPSATAAGHGRAAVRLASGLAGYGEPAETREVLDYAIASLIEAYGDDHPEVLEARRNLADHLDYQAKDPKAARALLEEVLAAQRRIVGPRSRAVAASLIVLSNVASNEGRPEESTRLLLEAREIIIERSGARSQDLMAVALNLAADFEQLGRIDEALASAREAEALAIAILGAESRNAEHIGRTVKRLEDIKAGPARP
jgi:tetratricopeptide (TPR) repeat protein/tRNA A-37 threonylcarbamoyl transferase component Bud32